MAQTKPKAGQFYGVSNNGTDGQFLKTDGTGGMSWDSPITNPTITSIDYPGSATAADPAGGESVIINGTLFASGITCTVGGTSAVTAFNSSTQITITTPAKAAGPYTVAVTNTDGGTVSENNFIQYSGVPVWSTAAGTLGNVLEGTSASFQVTATEGSDTIEYAVTTGTLPTGLSLATATGAITGTAPAVSADTTTTFSITATDDENQTSSERSFSITVQNDAPSNHFNTVIYTGTSSTQAVTGTAFEPDFVWIKDRTDANSHILQDSVRGANKALLSNATSAEITSTDFFTSFDSNGFTLPSNTGQQTNKLNNNYVAWNFKAGGVAVTNSVGTIDSQVSANNTLGFSVVKSTYTSTASYTVGHGLSERPQIVFNKNLDQSDASYGQWWTWIEGITGNNGDYIRLNATNGKNAFSDTFTTDTTIKYSTDFQVTGTNKSIISYAFTSKPGFSKVGTYTGNGSTNGTMVQTGFEPAFLMIKRTDASGASWLIVDNKRVGTANEKHELFANTSSAESSSGYDIAFLSNGFQLQTTTSNANTNGGSYIYLAFAADGSTATPSLASSFSPTTYAGTGGTQSITTGFKPDLLWIGNRTSIYTNLVFDSIRGADITLCTSNTNGSYNGGGNAYMSSFDSNGFSLPSSGNAYINASGSNYVAWAWKAGGTPSINTDGTITSVVSANQAAGFSIVQFNSTSAANSTIGHGLSAAPDLVIAKRYDSTGNWAVQVPPLSNGYLLLNSTQALNASDTSIWNATAPTSSVFTAAGGSGKFFNAGSFMSYCFTSIAGYSKVGTYSGTASANSITTGFEPGFIMIKRTDSTGSWVVMDSARGMGSNAYALFPNLNASESNNWNTAFTATGFTISSAEAWINASGGTYIYLAIKEN